MQVQSDVRWAGGLHTLGFHQLDWLMPIPRSFTLHGLAIISSHHVGRVIQQPQRARLDEHTSVYIMLAGVPLEHQSRSHGLVQYQLAENCREASVKGGGIR